ncbi:MAG: hypothetical protein KatS3mg113_0187 [Planctomycetaceae bacterium]|nr:MAG: hypothetical protein KatS3mg113_0187 [Planctomycetaceae bacterium]
MAGWTLAHYVLVGVTVAATTTCLYTDLRWGRIPNAITLPLFLLGWLYQLVGHPGGPWAGFLHGLQGFALGFGVYFLLWLVAGSGGGDVKLMGALGVWLGFRLVFWVIVVSTVLVALDLLVVTMYRVARYGVQELRKSQSLGEKDDVAGRRTGRERRRLKFAVPLALAVWLVLLADVLVLKGGPLPP